MRVIFLGTSSGTPTLARSLPSVVLQRGSEVILFDCGEGAQLQFRRAGLRPGRLSRVFISHLHGDHVLGLPGFLMSLQLTGRASPLEVHGPPGIRGFITGVLEMVQAQVAFPLEILEHDGDGVAARAAGYTVEFRALDHRVPCLGYALVEDATPGTLDVARARRLGVPDGQPMGRLKGGQPVTLADGTVVRPSQVVAPARPGLRVAYCTDTRPCEAAVILASGADLLIHEATFGSERAEDAHAKGHSTARDAAEIAAGAGARRLALTHISPRYSDPEPLLVEAREVFPSAVVAADLLVLDVP